MAALRFSTLMASLAAAGTAAVLGGLATPAGAAPLPKDPKPSDTSHSAPAGGRDRKGDHDQGRDHDNGARGQVVSKSPLNVREAPSTRSGVVGQLHPEDIAKIKCKLRAENVMGNDIWYRLSEQPQGWVTARYVKNLDSVKQCSSRTQ